MKKILYSLCVTASLFGCATSTMVPYQVESTPPGAQIDVNGNSMGVTPTEIQLQCSKRWVGVCVAPGGWAYDNAMYEIVAYPSKDNPGISQTKRVNACELKNQPGRIHFDLKLDPISPRQRVDVNVNQNNKATTTDETLRTLKRLRDQGVLSEQEYQQKVDKVVKEASQ